MKILLRTNKPIDSKRRIVLPKEFVKPEDKAVEITVYEDKVVIRKIG